VFLVSPEESSMSLENRRAGAAKISAADFANEAALKILLTIETKQIPLRALLDEIEKRSGVRFSVKDESATSPTSTVNNRRLTLRVKEMPLASLLGALTRLYGIQWSKSGEKEYSAQFLQTETEDQLLRLGDISILKERLAKRSRQQRTDLTKEILNQVPRAKLQSASGVDYTSLAPDIQQRLRNHISENIALDILETSQSSLAALIENSMLSITPALTSAKSFPINVSTSPERGMPSFRLFEIKASDIENQERSKKAD
jgi:hypothetical protein